jgi:hypothetical protein
MIRLSDRSLRAGAWALWGMWLGASLFSLTWALVRSGGEAVGILMAGYATVGLLVVWRRPRSTVGWLMLAFALAVAIQTAGETYSWSFSAPGYMPVAVVTQLAAYPAFVVLLVLVPLTFPDGRLPSPRWRYATWLGVAALVLGTVGATFGRHVPNLRVPVENPLAVPGAGEVMAAVEKSGQILLIVATVTAFTGLSVRFARSHGPERQQLKWFTAAGILMVTSWSLLLSEAFTPGLRQSPISDAAWLLTILTAVLGFPVATAIAIFRYHLYDIDVVIRRTVVYGTLTATLLATYVGCVLLLNLLLNPLAGGSDLAVACSTLAAAALFRPARRRIQATVDRRFYRRRYDATRTLEDFTTRLRHQIDLDTVGTDLCSVAHDTVQPAHVSLWIRP